MSAPDSIPAPRDPPAAASTAAASAGTPAKSPVPDRTLQKTTDSTSNSLAQKQISKPQPEKTSLMQRPDLAESTGEIAEKEADEEVVGGDTPPSTTANGGGSTPRTLVNGGNESETEVDEAHKPARGKIEGGSPRKRKTSGSKPAKSTTLASTYPPLVDTASRDRVARDLDHAVAHRAGGIRFAPWNIPYRRRLQTCAVIMHCLSIATTVSFFFMLCGNPFCWPILIVYLLHMLLSKAATDGRLRMRSDRFRRLPVWNLFAEYFPVRLHKTHELPPTRKYIFGYHPHGIISHGAFAAFGTEALGFAEKFPGITNSLLTLDSNFRIPLYRDYILACGIQSVSKESITNILTKGGTDGAGMGRAVTIVVGGARESLEAQPGIMHLVLAERKGFVKMAMRTGADLVPVMAFGENDLYDQLSPKSHPRLHKLQMWVLRTLKFTLPFLHGRGIFNYDVGLMPYRRPMNIVVGRPIRVTQVKSEAEILKGDVDRLHGEYLRELEIMWETYKDVFARGRKEELQILK